MEGQIRRRGLVHSGKGSGQAYLTCRSNGGSEKEMSLVDPRDGPIAVKVSGSGFIDEHSAIPADDGGPASNPSHEIVVMAAHTIERILGTLVEVPVAILVVAEVFVLLAGITARHVFQTPLIWSDELASILFLWLAMLGAVVAFRRSEHMRMTALVASAGPRLRAYLDVVATCAALVFLLLIIHPAYEY